MRALRVILLVIASSVLVATQAAAQPGSRYRVIVHPDNPTSFLTSEEVSELFLKTKTTWQHGTSVEPVDLFASSPVRGTFSEEIHGRPLSAIQSYWQQRIFSGRGVPPPEVQDDAEVVAFVRARAGAVGYVSAGTALTGVKALSVRFAPERVHYVPPRYPPLAQRARVEGTVVLQVVVSRDGEVADVRVVKGLAHGLSDAAVQAAYQWKFRPAMQDGEPIETSVNVAVQFQLR